MGEEMARIHVATNLFAPSPDALPPLPCCAADTAH